MDLPSPRYTNSSNNYSELISPVATTTTSTISLFFTQQQQQNNNKIQCVVTWEKDHAAVQATALSEHFLQYVRSLQDLNLSFCRDERRGEKNSSTCWLWNVGGGLTVEPQRRMMMMMLLQERENDGSLKGLLPWNDLRQAGTNVLLSQVAGRLFLVGAAAFAAADRVSFHILLVDCPKGGRCLLD